MMSNYQNLFETSELFLNYDLGQQVFEYEQDQKASLLPTENKAFEFEVVTEAPQAFAAYRLHQLAYD